MSNNETSALSFPSWPSGCSQAAKEALLKKGACLVFKSPMWWSELFFIYQFHPNKNSRHRSFCLKRISGVVWPWVEHFCVCGRQPAVRPNGHLECKVAFLWLEFTTSGWKETTSFGHVIDSSGSLSSLVASLPLKLKGAYDHFWRRGMEFFKRR